MKSFCYRSSGLSAHMQGSVLPLLPSPLWCTACQLQQPLLCNSPSTHREPAGHGLGSLYRQKAWAAAQLVASVSQLPEITADPLWPDAQFFHSLSFVYFGHFSEDL